MFRRKSPTTTPVKPTQENKPEFVEKISEEKTSAFTNAVKQAAPSQVVHILKDTIAIAQADEKHQGISLWNANTLEQVAFIPHRDMECVRLHVTPEKQLWSTGLLANGEVVITGWGLENGTIENQMLLKHFDPQVETQITSERFAEAGIYFTSDQMASFCFPSLEYEVQMNLSTGEIHSAFGICKASDFPESVPDFEAINAEMMRYTGGWRIVGQDEIEASQRGEAEKKYFQQSHNFVQLASYNPTTDKIFMTQVDGPVWRSVNTIWDKEANQEYPYYALKNSRFLMVKAEENKTTLITAGKYFHEIVTGPSFIDVMSDCELQGAKLSFIGELDHDILLFSDQKNEIYAWNFMKIDAKLKPFISLTDSENINKVTLINNLLLVQTQQKNGEAATSLFKLKNLQGYYAHCQKQATAQQNQEISSIRKTM